MRALIAMSGGVDSSVAAYLAQREGYECIGCTMKLYTNTDAGISERHTCCSLDDVEDARAVAYRLGIRYCVFNFSEGFREQVMLPFCEAYRRARTPNPCIECNRRMKFDALFRRAEELGCEKIVTGHYARIARAGERYILQKALDETRTRAMVLYAMTRGSLRTRSSRWGPCARARHALSPRRRALATRAKGTARTSALPRTATMPPLSGG